MRYSIALAWILGAGLLTGCFKDQNNTWHFVPFSNSTQAVQAEAQYSDPWPDPNLSHVDPGMRPQGLEQPREPYPVRPAPAPVIVTPTPPGTVTAPYPSSGPYSTTAPGWFPAASPAPYPGATPNFSPTPGPAPAPYELR